MTRKAVSAPAVDPKMTVAQAVRDVFIASINKGQFPFAIIGAIVLLLIWRLPEHEVSALTRWLVERLIDMSLVGWVLFVLCVFCWFFHAQKIRRDAASELEKFYALERKKRSSKAPKEV